MVSLDGIYVALILMGNLEVDFSAGTLFRRCVTCAPTPPPCPSCASDEVCSLTGGGCNTCAVTQCMKIGAQPTSSPPSGGGEGPNAGAIAGGVIGGIAVVCLMTYLVYRFCIKKRRQDFGENDWPEETGTTEKSGDDFISQRDARASTHSFRSIASTIQTRASNIIQIAYIPGVTNRSIESTPDLIPPVPPIPAMSPAISMATTPLPGQDQHFFMPSDLRDSTYSDYTVDRTMYARSSMTPTMARGSVPSTAYRDSAVVNAVPAQTAIRGKANPVAVRSNGKNSPAGSFRSQTPITPAATDRQRQIPQGDFIQTNITSPIVARLGVPKAVTVRKAQSKDNLTTSSPLAAGSTSVSSEKTQRSLAIPERHISEASSGHHPESSTFDDTSSSDEDSPADQSLMGHDRLPQFAKTASLSSRTKDSPFRSPSSAPDLRDSRGMLSSSSASASSDSQGRQISKDQKKKHKRSGSLNQIIEEATRRASREPRHGGLGSVGSVSMLGAWKRELRETTSEGPFSDANAARTP